MLELKAKAAADSNSNPKNKGGGQECPPYTYQRRKIRSKSNRKGGGQECPPYTYQQRKIMSNSNREGGGQECPPYTYQQRKIRSKSDRKGGRTGVCALPASTAKEQEQEQPQGRADRSVRPTRIKRRKIRSKSNRKGGGQECPPYRLLYYITDRAQFRGDEKTRRRFLLDKIAEAASAGVDYIQLREKDLSARELELLARQCVTAVREHSPATRLLVNSRTDVALAAPADGVHLRSNDVTPHEVRQAVQHSALRPARTGHFLIAASCHSVAEVVGAAAQAAAFAVFAPVFGKTKATPPAGLAALREACQAQIPVLALGGVTLENAAACFAAGAAGVAGIRLFQENKIADVVRALRAL